MSAQASQPKVSATTSSSLLVRRELRPSPSPWLLLNVPVADVMSRAPVSIGSGASLMDALAAMRAGGFSGLPVVDASGGIVGVVSERDVARVIAGALSRRRVKALLDVLMVGITDLPEPFLRRARVRLEQVSVAEAMSSPPYTIRPEAPLELAADVMTENRINRLPVVDQGRLVGIVTRNDLAHAMVRGRRRARPSSPTDRVSTGANRARRARLRPSTPRRRGGPAASPSVPGRIRGAVVDDPWAGARSPSVSRHRRAKA